MGFETPTSSNRGAVIGAVSGAPGDFGRSHDPVSRTSPSSRATCYGTVTGGFSAKGGGVSVTSRSVYDLARLTHDSVIDHGRTTENWRGRCAFRVPVFRLREATRTTPTIAISVRTDVVPGAIPERARVKATSIDGAVLAGRCVPATQASRSLSIPSTGVAVSGTLTPGCHTPRRTPRSFSNLDAEGQGCDAERRKCCVG